jgi:signal transduction histidine kinase
VGAKSPADVITQNIDNLLLSAEEFEDASQEVARCGFFEKHLGPLFGAKHVYMRAHSIVDAQNRVCGLEGTIIDVSEILMLQRALEVNKRILEVVGHELLSPVVAIDGTVDMILRMLQKADANNDVQKLSQKVEDIRLFNKLMEHLVIDVHISGHGKPILCESSLFNLRELVRSMVFFISPILRLHGLDVGKIALRYDPKVGQKVNAAKLHFMQVLFNLFTNFIKYREGTDSFQAGVEVKTKDPFRGKKSRDRDSEVVIDIWDSGVGVPKGEEIRIFEPGYKASNTSTLPGKGLGLNVVRRIVEHYNGTVFLANRAKPTIFRIVLPGSIFY